MESRANYAAIGAFVLVMLMTGLGFLYWLTNAGERAKQADIRVVFSGAVTGLNTGSAVLFNGIRIGEVAELSLDENDPNTVVAIIRVDRTKPVRTDTRAILSYQGLTGVANLQLEGGSRNAPLLLDSVEEGGIPTIQAEVSPFQDIMESARNVLNRADNAMAAIDDFIADNGPAFNRTVNNVETFSKALADNSDGISGALQALSTAAEGIKGISDSLQGGAKRAEEILNAIDPRRVETLVAEVTASAERLDRVLTRAEEVANGLDPAKIDEAVANVAAAAKTLNGTIERADAVIAAVDPKEVDDLVASLKSSSDQVGAAVKRARELVDAVSTEQVKSIVSSTDTTMKHAADVSSTVGGVVTSAKDALRDLGEVIGAVDPAKVSGTVDNVEAFTRTLRDYKPEIDAILGDVKTASEGLRNFGSAIDERSRDVGIIVTDARNLVAQMNGIAERTSGILRKVDAYVEGDGQGLIEEATATLKSIRGVAETLNARVGPITANIETFSGRGLKSFVDLANEGRQALGRLDRVLAGVERNPQQFIFGGQGVPEYAPRR